MRREYPRDPLKIASPSEKNEAIIYWVGRYDDERRMRTANESVLRDRTKEVRGVQTDLRKAKSEVALITKKAAAQKSFRETSGWSAAAIGSVTLFWAGFGDYGFPGHKWLFEHDVFYGAVCWAATSVFAWAAKSFYGAD